VTTNKRVMYESNVEVEDCRQRFREVDAPVRVDLTPVASFCLHRSPRQIRLLRRTPSLPSRCRPHVRDASCADASSSPSPQHCERHQGAPSLGPSPRRRGRVRGQRVERVVGSRPAVRLQVVGVRLWVWGRRWRGGT
jgi:hypothetical protein